jgi:glycine/D-amino acid oxidase-like deaminating enzyme
MSDNKNIIIVGGGVIGCSIAYHLGLRGYTSTIIEKESIAARASGKAWAVMGPTGALRLFEMDPPDISMFHSPKGESVAHWIELFNNTYTRIYDVARDLKDRGGMDIDLATCPIDILAFNDEDEKAFKSDIATLNASGLWELHWVGPEEVHKSWPDVTKELKGAIRTIVHQVEPYKFTLGLAQAAEKMGAKVKQGDVVGFGSKEGQITSVKLASGKEIQGDAVVIAMGPWSTHGTKWLGKELPMQLVLEACLRMEVDNPLPIHGISDGKYTILPRVGGKELIMGSAGDPHLMQDDWGTALSDDHKYEILENSIELAPSMEDARLVEYRGDLQGWAPAPVYHKPAMGRVQGWENAFVATRFGTLGICQSLGAGELMADLIIDGNVPPAHQKLMEYLDPANG